MDDFLARNAQSRAAFAFEGSVELDTLRELDPATPADLLPKIRSIFEGFLKAFGPSAKLLRTPDDYALIHAASPGAAPRAERALRRDHPGCRCGPVEGPGLRPIFDAVRDAASESPVKVRLDLRSVASFRSSRPMQVPNGPRFAFMTEWWRSGSEGSEERGPAEWFKDIGLRSRRQGCTPQDQHARFTSMRTQSVTAFVDRMTAAVLACGAPFSRRIATRCP